MTFFRLFPVAPVRVSIFFLLILRRLSGIGISRSPRKYCPVILSFESVSYTHLDVYKRQNDGCAKDISRAQISYVKAINEKMGIEFGYRQGIGNDKLYSPASFLIGIWGKF